LNGRRQERNVGKEKTRQEKRREEKLEGKIGLE
jgi:hypothetical protein